MALITCKDCKKEFSTDARRCPHCGANKPSDNKLLKWVCVYVVVAYGILGLCSIGSHKTADLVIAPAGIINKMAGGTQVDKRPICGVTLSNILLNPSLIPNEQCVYSYGQGQGEWVLQAMQITSDGILVQFPPQLAAALGATPDRLIFLYSDNVLEGNLVDGSMIAVGYFSYEGRYQYTAVLGQQKSVYSFRRLMNYPPKSDVKEPTQIEH